MNHRMGLNVNGCFGDAPVSLWLPGVKGLLEGVTCGGIGIAEPTLHPHPQAGDSWTGLPTGNRPGSSYLFDLNTFSR